MQTREPSNETPHGRKPPEVESSCGASPVFYNMVGVIAVLVAAVLAYVAYTAWQG